MKLIIQTTFDENTGINYALVEITQELAKLILRRKKAFARLYEEDEELCCLKFDDINTKITFFDGSRLGDEGELEDNPETHIKKDLLTKEQREELGGKEFVRVHDNFELYEDDYEQSMCGESMVILDREFGWAVTLEYDGTQISTWSQPYSILNQIL